LRPNPERPVIEKLIDYQEFCGIPQAAAAEQAASKAIAEMSVQDLKQLMDSGQNNFVLLDVRNPNEYEIAKIDGSVLIPLSELEDGSAIQKVKELVNGHRLIAHCKLGGRSAKALNILREAGIEGTNVKGGIAAWSQEIDSSIPQY
ncbi:MAG: rhodanese-like domain-containing protein, partial [Waterburya sp.]